MLSKTISSDRGILIFIRNLSGCINNYLVPHYIVLHTQGTGYIVDDISEYLKIRDFRSENTPHFLNGQVINQEEVLEEIYQESLEERIISHLAEVKELSFSDAMMVYYSSKLACRIHRGEYVKQNRSCSHTIDTMKRVANRGMNRNRISASAFELSR